MRCGVVVEELASDVRGELSADARREVLELVELVRLAPGAWPDVRDPGSVEEIREAFGARCWIQYMPHEGAIEVREIAWAG
ncbi:hypothetical protein [Streptomyces sp. SP18BB07]|uniref:hypothetical protein n=1 Tax=Streptomyces sp. SP18BB07 TaxID=3002522 RepID=UPI002E7A520D|nr:hypothetical protein [Streptomyces sp. SP18BB07]MEE1765325.1 hypothetical protein [Streptomyces sp. SP18BB07]